VEEEDLLRLRGASSVSSRQQTINVTDSNVTGIKISRISIYIQDNRYAYMERKCSEEQKLKILQSYFSLVCRDFVQLLMVYISQKGKGLAMGF